MDNLLSRYHNEWQQLHVIKRAALLHGEFAKVHPFIDGNGRTARLMMNFELMKSGYPPAVIKVETRPQYYDSLELASTTGEYSSFITLVADAVEESLDLWLRLV